VNIEIAEGGFKMSRCNCKPQRQAAAAKPRGRGFAVERGARGGATERENWGMSSLFLKKIIILSSHKKWLGFFLKKKSS
jgi:hypothetical protein